MKHDKEAPEHRKDEPAPDEEAYVTDKEAVEHPNIESATGEDGPQYRNIESACDKEALEQRKDRLIGGIYKH